MNQLAQLSPAETLVLLEGRKASLKDLIKFTFIDLLCRGVLSLKVEKRKAHVRETRVRTFNYVIKGKHFDQHQRMDHEMVFLSTFDKATHPKILLRNLIKVAFERVEGPVEFRRMIMNTPAMKELCRDNLLTRVFGTVKHTKVGKEQQILIRETLKSVDDKIARLLEVNPEAAVQELAPIGNNMVLLKNLDFKLLKKIDREMIRKQQKRISPVHKMERAMDVAEVMEFLFLDLVLDVFSDGFDDFDSDFDSLGCSSGDSGCSGCGGCGGCGGCA